MKGALSNTLAIDLSRLLPGPYCSMILADHGARVITVEDRRFEADALPEIAHINRNKEHMTLNLKSDQGLAVFRTLAKKADVLLEGFRPGVAKRLKIDYERISRINPGIVYCSVTGYGQTGPLRNQAGHDVNYMAASGLLSLNGPAEAPPCIPGIQIGDIAGGLYAAVGILLAMAAREKTGHGQYIDVSMTDALMSLAVTPAGEMWVKNCPPTRSRGLLSHRYACYNVYETADGRHITVGALERRFWERLCRCFGASEYAPLQFDDTCQDTLIDFLQNAFRQKTRNEWMEVFQDEDVCVGGVMGLDEALNSPAARQRGMTPDRAKLPEGCGPQIGPALKLSQTPPQIRSAPPRFGQHTHSILTELGYDERQIAQMDAEGAV